MRTVETWPHVADDRKKRMCASWSMDHLPPGGAIDLGPPSRARRRVKGCAVQSWCLSLTQSGGKKAHAPCESQAMGGRIKGGQGRGQAATRADAETLKFLEAR